MRFVIDQQHFDYFLKEHYVELEDFITPEQCQELQRQAEEALAKRLKINPSKLAQTSNKELFLSGRNVWKDGVDTKKTCHKKHVGDMAFTLFKKRPLRLAFDQYLRTGDQQDSPFSENLSLQQMCCFRPLLGGLLIFFSDPTSVSSTEGATFFPKKAGNALFVSAHFPLPLPLLFSQKNLSAVLFGISSEKTLYCLEKNDPHTHELKKEGFVFGDRVKEEQCPILFR